MEISELKSSLEQYYLSSYGWALSCCNRNSVEAEEVLQTVYLKILEGKARFHGNSSFQTWLFAVIRKTAADHRRRNLLGKLRLIQSVESTEPVSKTEELDESIHRSETQCLFRRALASLPKRQKEVLELVFYHDLSLQQAAEVIGVSLGSARTHYERGKRRLRELLEKEEAFCGVAWSRKENPGIVR